jgi:endo-1,4-beta-xylanase
MLRRHFTSRLLTTAALAGTRVRGESSQNSTLRGAGAEKNLLVGSAVSYAQLQRPEFTAVLAEQASVLVSENDMKWQNIHPERDRFDFTKGDALLSFATAHQQQVRGHNLCWHNQLPAWFKPSATSQNAADLLRRHIAAVAGHYAGRIHSWDVVNEAIETKDGRPDGLRNSIWLQLIGPQYLEIAFRAASAADPHVILTYNDYDLEQDSPAHNAKRSAVLQMLTSLRERNVPIGTFGLQSHLKADGKPSDWTKLHQFIEQLEKLSLQIFITELDVDDSQLSADITERDHIVGELYGDYLKNILQHRSVKAVLTWGLSDRGTWLNFFNRRADKLPQRPLPFDGDLKPTAAFDAMRDAIAACSPR